MKFAILDTTTTQHPDIRNYSDTFKYLDEFLDKTFLTDYFMLREQDRRDNK